MTIHYRGFPATRESFGTDAVAKAIAENEAPALCGTKHWMICASDWTQVDCKRCLLLRDWQRQEDAS